MINIDYAECGHAPLWLRQDNELLLNLQISRHEISCDEVYSAFFSRMEDEKIVVPIRVGDYRNIEYCRAKTKQMFAHVPSIQKAKLTFMMQGTRINVKFTEYAKHLNCMEIGSIAEIECHPHHIFLHLNFAGNRGTVDLTPEWEEKISIWGAKDKFAHLHSYLREANHFTDENGQFIEIQMPTMRSLVFRKDNEDVLITPENLLDASSTFSALVGSFVHIRYADEDTSSFKTLDLYFNPRNLKYGEPDSR